MAPVRETVASGPDGPDPASQRHRHCPRRGPTARGPDPPSRATRLLRPWGSCPGMRRGEARKAGPVRHRPGSGLNGRAVPADGASGALIGRLSQHNARTAAMAPLRARARLGLRRAVPTRRKFSTMRGGPAAVRPRAGGLVDKDSSTKNSLYGSLAAALRRGLRHQIRPAPARPPRGARNPLGRGMRGGQGCARAASLEPGDSGKRRRGR